jgi:hypothetical protein
MANGVNRNAPTGGRRMNQQEYIDISDRTKISCALRILEEIYAEQSSILEPSELQYVMAALREWEEKLLQRIRIG